MFRDDLIQLRLGQAGREGDELDLVGDQRERPAIFAHADLPDGDDFGFAGDELDRQLAADDDRGTVPSVKQSNSSSSYVDFLVAGPFARRTILLQEVTAMASA